MARHVFRLPDIGEGTAAAELVCWHVALGDVIEEDAPLADVMTDKATVEITSPVAGKIVALHGEVGEASQVGSPFVEFDAEGDVSAEAEAEAQSPAPDDVRSLVDANADLERAEPSPQSPRPKTSPAVRRRAREADVDLTLVKGTGPSGRIRKSDLDTYLAGQEESAAPPTVADSVDAYTDIKLVGLRRKIAEKMELSSRSIPHFSYTDEVDMTALELQRAQINAAFGEDRAALSVLPFMVMALCKVLPDFPQINATYDEDRGVVRQFTPVHVGIAAQTDNGLVVPVIKNAQRLGLSAIAAEISRLAAATRDGSAKRDELTGSTITITSLGKLGGVVTTPVINHPEVAIVGPNRIVERLVPIDGTPQVRKIMNISSSFDHRVVDGQDAARFIQRIRELLENPLLLLAL